MIQFLKLQNVLKKKGRHFFSTFTMLFFLNNVTRRGAVLPAYVHPLVPLPTKGFQKKAPLNLTNSEYDLTMASKTPARTRHQSGNKIVGPSSELPQADLPVLRDCLKYGLLKKEEAAVTASNFTNRDLAKIVRIELKNTWFRVNALLCVVTIMLSDLCIEQKFIREWEAMEAFKNKRKSAKFLPAFMAKLDIFLGLNWFLCRRPSY